MSTQLTDIEKTIRIKARPETVFSFFTDAQKLAKWQGSLAMLDPRPGGVYRVVINSHAIARGTYVEVVPYSRVVFTWGWEAEGDSHPPGTSTVEVSLTPDGDETVLLLVHKDLPSEAAAQHVDGWEHYLPRLALAATNQDPGLDPWTVEDEAMA